MSKLKKHFDSTPQEEDYDFLKDTEDLATIALALDSSDFYAHRALTWNPLLSGEQVETLYRIHKDNLLDQLRLLIAPNLTAELIHEILSDGKIKDARKGVAVRHPNASEESKVILALLA